MNERSIYIGLLSLLMLLAVTACSDSDPADVPASRPVSLAFSVSGTGAVTRMAPAVTQGNQSFRGIADQYLYPFSTTAVSSASTSLDRIEAKLERLTETGANNYYYFDDKEVNIPEQTRTFLCYCTAGNTLTEASKFDSGSTLFQGFSDDGGTSLKKNITLGNVSFKPEVIESSAPVADGVDFGTYLTETAQARNSLGSFVYPAELFYYTNSPIKTSFQQQKDNYQLEWNRLLEEYENETNGVMQGGVVSVAITKPLNYAVGRLDIGLLTSGSTLSDASSRSITLSDATETAPGTFPLTAVFVTGQYEQAFDLTPKDDTEEYIAYDKAVNGISLGAQAAYPGNNSSSKTSKTYSQTLVLQSKDGANVRFALEFENNSGAAFNSIYGTIEAGSKFYLVGTIRSPGYDGSNDQTRRAFTKDFVTSGTVTVNSLRQAYPYLPDLFNPDLEVSLELKTNWIQSTTTNVPL